MGQHNIGRKGHTTRLKKADPGNAGSILVKDNFGTCQLTSTGAETRTLARPTKDGQLIAFFMEVDGGDITLTVTGGYNENGDTTFVFSDPGQYAVFESFDIAGTFAWRMTSSYLLGNLSGLTATQTELNTLHTQTLTGGAGAGITGGTGTIYKTSVQKSGDRYVITIDIDLTGLSSSTTDLDIIGQSTTPAYIGLLNVLQAGATVHSLAMTCLEAPAGGVTDIDVYSATEGTGKFDDAVTGLTETALITSGGAWTNGATKGCTTVPLSTEYLYLTGGAAGTAAPYTAGKFRIVIVGYD